MGTEREAKLSVWPGFVLPDLAGVAEGIRVGPMRHETLDARYVDVADLRLLRMGITLRHRSGGDDGDGRWTLKVPLGQSGSVTERSEIHVAGPPGEVPAELRALVAGVARGAAVGVVGHLQTERRATPLLDEEGTVVAEVADDEVSVFDGDRVAARFREIEVEAMTEAPRDLLDAVVEQLRDAGAASGDPMPKLARAVGPRAAEPPDPSIRPLGDDPTAGELVQHAIAASVRRMLAHDPIVRLDAHDEGVHQMRVATRRLRSDLRTFAPMLDLEELSPTLDELRWLAGLLGEVRDLDVLGARLAVAAGDLHEADVKGVEGVLAHVAHLREPALAALHEALDSERYLALTRRLVELAEGPPLTGEADQPASAVAAPLVRGPWKKLRRAVVALPDDPPDEDLHAVRIRAKRARYAAEAVAPVAKRAAAQGQALAALQDVLGEHQDSVVAEDWLRDAAVQSLDPASAFAAGWIAALEEVEAHRLRGQWQRAWKRARREATWLTS